MNWVGGSRTRVLIKQERRKQKEYFEKKRLQSKIKLLEVLSPAKNSTVSLDLLNLYIVNQISCKKEIPENVRKPIHVNMNRDVKMPLRRHDLKLPMSPAYIPSKLCLDDTENNIHYQTPGSKEELGSVQSSQITDSHSMFETEFSRTENCTLSSPSFSAELSSDRHIPKQNITPRIASCPWKFAYEKKQNEQPSNVNYSDSLVSKLNESQGALSPSYKTTEFGTLFASLNSPGNRNFLTERPGIIMDEGFGSMDERRESVFITEKQLVQHNWGENRKVALNCHEDANQPIPSPLAENCDSFVSQNMISLLNIDQQRMQKTFDKCGYDSIGDTCAVPSFGENNSTDKCIRSIFTVPELTFSNSAFNNASYCKKCQPNKYCQKKHNDNERNHVCVSFEEHCYPACSEKKGKFENCYQKKITQNNIQKYPVNHMGNHIPLEELHSTQSGDFGVGEILILHQAVSLPVTPQGKQIVVSVLVQRCHLKMKLKYCSKLKTQIEGSLSKPKKQLRIFI
ncbi:regulator of DNA class I crossover intermediates 1 isoform X3 [Tamandua tetradactyla]|uniref:regulator of DNA class I crossover intermediates 1 isoform X3 n=1 Tax=Tamandua tetradactyla TaxID=48850 RepID=UPI0040537C66